MVDHIESYALFGNPVAHSQSPCIHKLFAEQLQIKYDYQCILTPLDNFTNVIMNFFKTGGRGANITLPFKEKACSQVDELTERARCAGAINTIKRLQDGKLLGDNTDGIALLNDLKRCGFIKPEYRILLIGAGGAAQSVIPSLLSLNCTVFIINRTFFRAKRLASYFSYAGKVSAIAIDDINFSDYEFDLVINATSSGIKGKVPVIPHTIITPHIFCYDMFYRQNDTPFLNWCKEHNAKYRIDGLGMLVEQAAHSILLWHGVFPDVKQVISKYRNIV